MGPGPPTDSPDAESIDEPESSSSGGSRLASAVRFLLALAVLSGLAIGAIAAGPSLIDDFGEFDDLPAPSGDPPPAGERDPDVTDPDDPNATSYETEVETVTSESVEDFVHAKVNDRRAEHGLEPLEWDGTIASVARAHSEDMHDRDYFSHTNPDGEDPYDRYNDVADYCRSYGENLAMNWLERPVEVPDEQTTEEYQTAEGIAEALVVQWMNSPDHRDAILENGQSHSWDRAGVGVYLSEEGEVYATQNFCTEW
ncbi:CAP domain-containing protein [Halostagnicola kamekurae]|uniref:Uncharacterized conserved protein YkwD, contains CAP (CSP/antigen 5/PR1) domain n=1 Tax=Halostagnicola kamekurae TaxID=619731 RepID=A0A1I6Q8C1_9EURY|nr:CAP domain-containing protein [Halostagnicola kamekurae]SFS48608.1 Uncharacterized conserved protein YkwD, contains CAP (CSP/antigen 5/PR1) domain [Halostagnicola kamekurae]